LTTEHQKRQHPGCDRGARRIPKAKSPKAVSCYPSPQE
jgi:hypothetical protein